MLVEVLCDQFISNGKQRGKIEFHPGLNTVLGDDPGSNSIGKTSFLMVLDFVFGGDDYIVKSADLQKEIGSHTVKFGFVFGNEKFFFSRSTDTFKEVTPCDENYSPIRDSISDKQYCDFLREKYGLSLEGLSFRNAVSRFIRVYGRETLNEKKPLRTAEKETESDSISSLLRLCDLYSTIKAQQDMADEAKDKRETFSKAKKYSFIKISNEKDLINNTHEIEALQASVNKLISETSSGFKDLDSEKKKAMSELQEHLAKCNDQEAALQSQLTYINSGKKYGGKSRIQKSVRSLQSFFPDININKIEQIEEFHSQLSGILKQEFLDAERKVKTALEYVGAEKKQIEEAMSEIAKETDLTKTVFSQYAAIDKKIHDLTLANDNYRKLKELKDIEESYKTALSELFLNSITDMELSINKKMQSINDCIYNGERTSPFLHFSSPKAYSFFTPHDSGTGSQYKGLIVFDLAMLELTRLPFIIHDSILLKQIADKPIEKILEQYESSSKQVFIAFDKVSSYSSRTQELLNKTCILRLSPEGNELYGRPWNKIEKGELHDDIQL